MPMQTYRERVSFPVSKGRFETVNFEISLDPLAIATVMGPEAWRAKTKSARALSGAVAIKVITTVNTETGEER